MSRIYVQNEGTAARRRFPVYLVDATDGITPETGESGGQPQISKAGGAWADTTATLTAIGNGFYYVELTATELDTLGMIAIRYKSGNTAEFNMDGQVVVLNIHDIVRAGLTALPNADAELDGGLITRGTGTGQLSVSGGRANADVTHWATSAVATPDTAGYPKVTIKSGTGTGELSIASGVIAANVTQFGGNAGTFASGRPEVNTTHWGGTAIASAVVNANAIQISGDATAANNLEAALDGTGGVTITANVTGGITGNITGNLSGSVGSVTGDVNGNVPALFTTAMTESYAADGAAPTLAQMLFMLWSSQNEVAISGTTITCKRLDGTTTSMTFTTDDATNPTSRTRST